MTLQKNSEEHQRRTRGSRQFLNRVSVSPIVKQLQAQSACSCTTSAICMQEAGLLLLAGVEAHHTKYAGHLPYLLVSSRHRLLKTCTLPLYQQFAHLNLSKGYV